MELSEPPIFILGAARSGTTLLRWALDSHPRIVSRSELNFLKRVVAGFKQEFLTLPSGDEFDPVKLTTLQVEHGVEVNPREIARRFRDLHESFYLDLCKRHAKARWADDTHTVLDYMVPTVDIMYDHTPMYLVITRHGLDVALSAQEKFGMTVERWLQYWCEVTELQAQFADRHPERCFRLRYEDLAADPQTVCNAVFRFLGEDPVKQICQQMFSTDHGPFGDHKIRSTTSVHTNSIHRWRTVPPLSYQDAVDHCPRFHNIISSLGY